MGMRLLTSHEKHEHRRGKSKFVKALLRRAKDVPCADCGGRFSNVSMDFDHIPDRGPKLFELSRCGGERTVADIEREMFKCEVVCSNCHRVRTATRAKQRIHPPGLSAIRTPRLVKRG